MRKYLDNINWTRVVKIAVLSIPVLLWDLTYFIVTKLYEGCTFIDKEGEKFLDKFLERD